MLWHLFPLRILYEDIAMLETRLFGLKNEFWEITFITGGIIKITSVVCRYAEFYKEIYCEEKYKTFCCVFSICSDADFCRVFNGGEFIRKQ